MIAVQKWLDESRTGTRMIMQVHDELVLEVPDGELSEVRRRLPELMCGVCRSEGAAGRRGRRGRQLGGGALKPADGWGTRVGVARFSTRVAGLTELAETEGYPRSIRNGRPDLHGAHSMHHSWVIDKHGESRCIVSSLWVEARVVWNWQPVWVIAMF